MPNCTTATFADDTAMMATGNSIEESTTKLQRASDNILSHGHENGELNSMKQNQRTLISPTKRLKNEQSFLMA